MRLAAPSFIKKADRITNVRFLKNYFDEIELLYMSSLYEGDEPDPIEAAALANEGVRFNVHMPYDRDFSIAENRQVMESFAELLRPLNAYTHTIHIQKEPDFFRNLSAFMDKTAAPVTLENSGDDAELFGLIDDERVGICADLGHVICHGGDVSGILKRWGGRIQLIHLHGTDSERDHKSLRHVDKSVLKTIKSFALEHGITVCLEVFDKEDLMESREIILGL